MGLALSLTLLTGCVAGPSVLKTQWQTFTGETYAENNNKPEVVKVIPIGEDVTVPQGKAALTLFVVIPQKQAEGDRQTQYIDFSTIRKVDVTITGENLASPVTTSIDVSSGTSAAGTVVLTPGRNQIITAVGRNWQGDVVSTVKGVATSVAGQVVNAEAKFGTTPLAEIVGGLSPEIAPQINLATINALVTPLLNPTSNNGTLTYSTHPSFINPAPVVNAINALISNGATPGDISTGMITDQLAGAQPLHPASRVTVRVVDPQGNPLTLANQGVPYVDPVDRDGDGAADGTQFSSNSSGGHVGSIRLSDPVSYGWHSIGGGYSQTQIEGVPPGSFQLTYDDNRVSLKPWETLPFQKTQSVTVSPGSVQTVDIRLIDTSKPTTVTAEGGSFSSTSAYSNPHGIYCHEWFRVPTEANVIYRLAYNAQGMPDVYGAGHKLMIFDQSGAQLFQSDNTSGSYTFASGAASTLYVYTRFINTTVDVTTEALGDGQSLYNASIHYNQ
jgi:hypothetical protein